MKQNKAKEQTRKRAKEMVAICLMKNADQEEVKRAKQQAIDICERTKALLMDMKVEIDNELIADRVEYYNNIIKEINTL